MKLVAHLVRADVRRFRLLLAAWVLIEVLSTVFTGVRPVLDTDPRLVTSLQLLGTVLFFTRWLGMVVLVALVVQTHPLVGSDAFWMTRPIPPRALLASKMLLLGTTVVAVPVLCEIVLMAACAAPIGPIVRVAVQTALFQALWLLALTALSATTRSLARFALLVGGLLVSVALLLNIMFAVLMRSIDDTLNIVTGRSASSPATGVALLLVMLAVAFALIVVQYSKRPARQSVGAGVAAVAVPVLIMWVWPWPQHPLEVPDWARRESALRLSAESKKGEFSLRERWAPSGAAEAWQAGSARLRLGGIEAGWVATARLADSSVQFEDGATLGTRENQSSSIVPFESVDEGSMRVVVRQILGVSQVHAASLGDLRPEPTPAIVLTKAEFRKYSEASGTYRGRFLVDLDRVEIAAVLPLRPGVDYREPRRRVVIDQIVTQAEAVSLRVRQFTMATIFDAEALPVLSFYLRNRDAAMAVGGSAHTGFGAFSTGFPSLMYGGGSFETAGAGTGFGVTGNYLRFPDAHFQRAPPVNLSAEWLSHAELVIVRTVQWGSVTRTVEIPGFEIRAAPPAPATVLDFIQLR